MKKIKIILFIVLGLFFHDVRGCSDGELSTLGNFLYLEDGQGAGLPGPALTSHQRKYIKHNNYPFSLPLDRVDVDTVFFSTQASQSPDNVSADPALRSIIQKKISHIIVENLPNLMGLGSLKSGIGVILKGYGLHFYGDIGTGMGSVKALMDEWSKAMSMAECHHLDFALSGFSAPARASFVLNILSLLGCGACTKLETLSLRYVNLNDVELNDLYTSLSATPKPFLKRLILSFNGLTDESLQIDGGIKKFIGDRTNFPKLSVLDMRGNKFEDLTKWAISGELHGRGHVWAIPKFKIYFNGFSKEYLEGLGGGLSGVAFTALKDFTTSSVLKGIKRTETDEMLSAFNVVADKTVKKKWFVVGDPYDPAAPGKKSPYMDFADQLVLMRHGKANTQWETLNLEKRRLEHEDIGTILRHVKRGTPLTRVSLKDSYKEGVAQVFDGEIVHQLSRFPLIDLNLGGNNLGNVVNSYADLGNITTLNHFVFSENGLRGSLTGPFLMALRHGFTNLISLDLSGNLLEDADFLNFLTIIYFKRKGRYDLSNNRLELTGVLISQLVDCLKGIAEVGGGKGCEISLKDNRITEVVAPPVVTGIQLKLWQEYRREIVSQPALVWPILKLDEGMIPKLGVPSYEHRRAIAYVLWK